MINDKIVCHKCFGFYFGKFLPDVNDLTLCVVN